MLLFQCCKRVADSVLKRGGTPILFSLCSQQQQQCHALGALVYIRIESIEMDTIYKLNCELKDVIPSRGAYMTG